MVNEKETRNGDLNCSFREPIQDGGGELFVNGSSSCDGTCSTADGLRKYKRRKRRKMTSDSDDVLKSDSSDKIKADYDSALDQNVSRLRFDAFPVGLSECSLRHSRKIVLQQMHQSVNGHEDGIGKCIKNAFMTYQENGYTSVMKESYNSVEAGENQTLNSAKEVTQVVCNESIKQSEASTISELCGHAFTDILNSDKFSELCDLLYKNFGVVNTNRILDVKAIHLKMKNGAYETSPMLYLKDIQQVWTKLQQVGNEMVTLAKSLSDKSAAHYEQFVRKSNAAEACGPSNCHGCGEKADALKCLVCDSCENVYHLNCTELVGTQIPPTSWYCASCVSNGIGSPHHNCVVCDKLKSYVNVERVPTNDESLDLLPNSFEMHEVTEESQGSKVCFICKNEVNFGDNFRTCGHSLCAHKFYHYKCLTNRQLGVRGPCWYCPSCLCRRCLVDKDDDQIVLCDGCDQAYHIYCATPQLNCVPKGSWFCGKCDRELKRIRTMKKVYETIQKKVKVEDVSEHSAVNEGEERNKSGGLDILVTAAKTLGNHEITDLDTLRNLI